MISLKKRLAANQLTIGSWISLAHPAIAEIMSRAGFDWLTIDLEHSVITIKEAEELIRVICLCGINSLVRLTSNDADQIKRVMDAGAHGIIVPMVNSKTDAIQAINALYYPPKGKRGVGLARAQGYGVNFANYQQQLKNETVFIAQIEHIDAVNNIEEILSLPDVDGYIIGPYDLSASMGLIGELDHPDVVKSIAYVRTIGKKLNKPGGIHCVEPDSEQLQKYIDDGFTFLAYSVDTRMLDTVCRKSLAKLRLSSEKDLLHEKY